MGRVSRYKKVKAFDTFAKNGTLMQNVWGLGDNGRRNKKRSLTSKKLRQQKLKHRNKHSGFENEGFDLPPSGADEFDLNDLLGSLKTQKVGNALKEETTAVEDKKTAARSVKFAVPKAPEALPNEVQKEIQEAKLLKLTSKGEKKKQKEADMQRKEGESKNAFKRRMMAEVRDGIADDKLKKTQNQDKKKRKKEFLNAKKQKKRKKSGNHRLDANQPLTPREGNSDGDESGAFIAGEEAAAAIVFGEQAERPPTFQLLPRGAAKKKETTAKATTRKSGASPAQIEAEQKAMENMRRKVQAQYALIKAKRKRDGDFHL